MQVLQHHEARNCGFIKELPIVSMSCGSMGKRKTTPILTFPHNFFSCQTPYTWIVESSASESNTNGKLYLLAKFKCEFTLSLLMPITTAFLLSISLFLSANAHACRVQTSRIIFRVKIQNYFLSEKLRQRNVAPPGFPFLFIFSRNA